MILVLHLREKNIEIVAIILANPLSTEYKVKKGEARKRCSACGLQVSQPNKPRTAGKDLGLRNYTSTQFRLKPDPSRNGNMPTQLRAGARSVPPNLAGVIASHVPRVSRSG